MTNYTYTFTPETANTQILRDTANTIMQRKSSEPASTHLIEFAPGTYLINEPIEFVGNTDISMRLCITGKGRRMTTIHQTDASKPVFVFKTRGGNMRDIVVEDMTVSRGSYGFDTDRTAYNVFRNVSFDKQWVAGIKTNVSIFDTYENCWWVHGHLTGDLTTSMIKLDGGHIGEDMGGWTFNSTTLIMNDVTAHSVSAKGNQHADGEKTFFDVSSGSTLILNGGLYTFIGGDAVMRLHYPRDVSITGTVFNLPTEMKTFALGRIVSSGTKPDPSYIHRGGIVITKTEEPFEYYKSITSYGPHVHKYITCDAHIQVRNTNAFSWGTEVTGHNTARFNESTILENKD
jgi:hypothetical protein